MVTPSTTARSSATPGPIDDEPERGHDHRSCPTSHKIVAAGFFIAATATAAICGSLVNQSAMEWYDGLDKPWFTPPGATFGIVWTPLYVLVAMAGFLGWRETRRHHESAAGPTTWWVTQIALNLAWTVVFFGLQSPVGGLIVIAALIVAIVGNIVVVWDVSRMAAWLLAPYLLWVCFATALNVGIVALN